MLDTLANVKTRLGITTSDDDTFLQTQIDLVSDAIEAYCRRVFLAGNWVQTFYRGDYIPSRLVELFYFPLISIASIIEDGVTLDSSQYRIHKPTSRIISPHHGFFYAQETVITFNAGYDTTPKPVLSVLDSIVNERYTKKKSGVDLNFGNDVQRISIPGSISIDFDYTLTTDDRTDPFGIILGNNLNILDFYRSERSIVGDSKMRYIEAEVL